MPRQGQFTIPNLIGTVVLFFMAWVMWGPMSNAIAEAYSGANVLTKAALVIILPTVMVAIMGYILTSSERREQPRPPRSVERPRRRGGGRR